ncbi:hypothetical protein [Aminobacter sp. MSH1]|uniref:hypothetical protein n=1 Tax=Aminobacter sp. MSH1 TaxID=374606 RepID=UPI00131F0DEB
MNVSPDRLRADRAELFRRGDWGGRLLKILSQIPRASSGTRLQLEIAARHVEYFIDPLKHTTRFKGSPDLTGWVNQKP